MTGMIDEIFIALGLKSDGVKKGMKEAEGAISQGVSSITSKLSALGAAFTAAMSLGVAFKQYTEQADAMGKLADALDVDIEKMHAWGEAAARAGGSVEGFQGSLQSLTTQLARQATVGTSRAAKMLEGVGIDAGEIGRQRQAFDVMMDLAEKAESMGKQEFFGLGRSLGLDQGTIMLLQQGRTALKDAIQAQKEFGVYTKEDAKVTADFNDRMADFGQVFRSFAAIVFRMVLPTITKFIQLFNKAIAFIRQHERVVQAFVIMVATLITGLLIPAFVKLAATIMANPLTWLVAILAAIAIAIDDLIVWATEGESAFDDFWASIFGSPENARQIWADLQKSADEFISRIPEYKSIAVDLFDAILKYDEIISSPFTSLANAVGLSELKFEDLRNVTMRFFDFVRTWDELLTAPIRNFIDFLKMAKSVWDSTLGSLSLPSFGSASFSLPGGGSSSYTGNTDNSTHDATYNINNTIYAQDGRDAGNQFVEGMGAFNARQADGAIG